MGEAVKMTKRRTVNVTITFPIGLLASVDKLVQENRYASRSALITEAVRHLLERELDLREKLKRKLKQEWEG